MTIRTHITRAHFSRWFLVSCVAFVMAVPHRAAAQQVSQVVVFGDSLSDSGNAFALFGTVSTPPDYPLGAPYARGGHHFLNGATWVEQLARPLGLAASVRPAFQESNAGATNFAVSGARAREDGFNVNLPTQVQAFLLQSGGVAPSDALYVIEIGGNDIRDALFAGQNWEAVLDAAVASIESSITALHAAGARTFLVWNAPDAGRTPAALAAGPVVAQFATFLSQFFNAKLAFALEQLSLTLPAIQIVPFDAFSLINGIVANPSAYGMTNVISPCLTPGEPPFACLNPDEYLFWDVIHPTRAAHAIVAAAVAALLFS